MTSFEDGRLRVYLQTGYDGQGSPALLLKSAALFCAAIGCACPGEGTLRRTALGKPYFDCASAPCFSLSHSGEMWGAAFAPGSVGFDLERVRPRAWENIARRYFHPLEREMALACGEAAFFSVWTAKESYVKYLGTGIDDAFSAFSVVRGGRVDGGALGVSFVRPPMPPGYCACACVGEGIAGEPGAG